MITQRLLLFLVAAPSVFAACGSDDLTSEQKTAYRQIVAYAEHPERVVIESTAYQQAAAQQMRKNVRILRDADLGGDADAALTTLAENPIMVTSSAASGSAQDLARAIATLKDAAAERR